MDNNWLSVGLWLFCFGDWFFVWWRQRCPILRFALRSDWNAGLRFLAQIPAAYFSWVLMQEAYQLSMGFVALFLRYLHILHDKWTCWDQCWQKLSRTSTGSF
ncbi:unnamed protein product [Notodromas monacha]|uniref:Uncharacterized protein n=1 Tax=Notodromas monacha TaxID=399045 RepID=A0A7R9BKW0_9CRUS|nr:unnamed protein product [Notodromas monacha]CAG0916524.1 unnamed protein product [Notodromas monacha]